MLNFTTTKTVSNSREAYKLIFYKTVPDRDGNDVEVEDKVEIWTKEDLQREINTAQEAVNVLQERMDAILMEEAK